MFRADVGHTGRYASAMSGGALSVAWQFDLPNREASSPTVCDGILYVEAGRNGDTTYPEGALYALDAKSGRLVWKVATSNTGDSTPAVAYGLVYFAVGDDALHALNARNGKPHWSFPLSRHRQDRAEKRIEGSATVAGDAVFVNVSYAPKVAGGGSLVLYALDAKTGRKRWSAEWVQAVSSPVVHEGLVFTGHNSIFAFAESTGAKRWEYALGTKRKSTYSERDEQTDPLVAVDGVLYVATVGGSVHALEASSGRLLWRFERDGEHAASAAPAAANGTVFIGAVDGSLHALDAKTGIAKWRFRADAQVTSTPTVAGETVCFGDWDGNLYGLDVHSGKETWRVHRDRFVFSQPASVEQGSAFVTAFVRGDRKRHEVFALR